MHRKKAEVRAMLSKGDWIDRASEVRRGIVTCVCLWMCMCVSKREWIFLDNEIEGQVLNKTDLAAV